MLQDVKTFIQQERLVQTGDLVVVACSGGPDSLALLHIMWRLQRELGISLAAAHVDHMLRGDAGRADARFVQEFCATLGVPCSVTAVDVPARVKQTGQSVEEAARELRYRCLHRCAARYGPSTKIAVGHNLDDQAETVLLHLLRGAGSRGLAGMAPRTPTGIIRPLLTVTRRDIEAYCREHGLTPRRDATNWDTTFTRNKVRLELLPLLRRRFNPNVSRLLAQTAQVLREEHNYITAAAQRALSAMLRYHDGAYALDLARWRRLPAALQREILRLIVDKIVPSLKGITFNHVETLLAMGRQNGVRRCILPGPLYVEAAYGRLSFSPQPTSRAAALPPAGVPLVVPGITRLPTGAVITATIATAPLAVGDNSRAVLDYDAIEPPLLVRSRRPGDRFVPLGAPGAKKLQDFFVDAKVPRMQRDAVPLVCDQRGIVWVGGWRPAERVKVTAATRRYLLLQLHQAGEDR